MLTRHQIGGGAESREIAVRSRPARSDNREPALVWFGGFMSDMVSTKAAALNGWAERAGRAFARFDYSGHGESSGLFENGTVGRWLEEGLSVIDQHVAGPAILVGSSMGGWIATLAAVRRRAQGRGGVAGLVLIAPAIDFTERLMWDEFPEATRRTLVETGRYLRPSAYSAKPYPITLELIEEGRNHLILGLPIDVGCPVHILQGMRDEDVPWRHALRLVEALPGESVQLTLIKDGDHRLSRPEDLERLIGAIEAMSRAVSPS